MKGNIKMMSNVLIAAAIACSSPVLENHTKTWDKIDQMAEQSAEKRCGQLFPDGPCMKVFIKNEDKDGVHYRVVCGPPNEAK
jgi:hypothetical protein